MTYAMISIINSFDAVSSGIMLQTVSLGDTPSSDATVSFVYRLLAAIQLGMPLLKLLLARLPSSSALFHQFSKSFFTLSQAKDTFFNPRSL